MALISFLQFFVFAVSANTAEGLLFGPEWTFTNAQLMNTSKMDASAWETLQALSVKILAKCPTCQQKISFPEIEIRINQDVSIRLTPDSRVIEINAAPMTISVMRAHRDLLQELVWNSAAELGLKPHVRVGGGHLHIQKPYQPQLDTVLRVQRPFSWIHRLFKNAPEHEFSSTIENPDILLMRNFLADLWKRPALFLGALGFNLRAARPLSSYSSNLLDSIHRKVTEFDRGEMGIESLIRYHNTLLSPSGDSRNLAINLEHAQTIEIRGLRPQLSFYDYLKICELIESRIRTIAKTHFTPIPFEVPIIKTWSTRQNDLLVYHRDLSDEDVRQQFRSYVESASLNWESYMHFPLASPGATSPGTVSQGGGAAAIAVVPARCEVIFMIP